MTIPDCLLAPLIYSVLPQIKGPPEAQRPYTASKPDNSQLTFTTSAIVILKLFQRCPDLLPLQHCQTLRSRPLVPATRQRLIHYQGRNLGRGIVSGYASFQYSTIPTCHNQI